MSEEREVSQNEKVVEIEPDYSDTSRYRVLKNGAVYDMVAKRIVSNPGGGSAAITQANASEYHQMRRDKALRALESGMRGAGKKLRVADYRPFTSEYGAIEAMASNMTRLAIEDGTYVAVKAFETLMKHGDFVQKVDKQAGNTVTATFSDTTAANLIELLSKLA